MNSDLIPGTQTQCVNDTGLSVSTIKRYFKILLNDNLVEKCGNRKYLVKPSLHLKISLLEEVYKFE